MWRHCFGFASGCVGTLCRCVGNRLLGAGLDVQQPHDSGIISAVLFKLFAQRFNLRLAVLFVHFVLSFLYLVFMCSCTRTFPVYTKYLRNFTVRFSLCFHFKNFFSVFVNLSVFSGHRKTSSCSSIILHGEAFFYCLLFMDRFKQPFAIKTRSSVFSALFTPLGKFFVRTLDVVAALYMMTGALGIVDAGSGIVIRLCYAALFDHRVRQRNG